MNELFLKSSLPELHKEIERGALSFSDIANEVVKLISTKESETFAWVHHDLEHLVIEAQKKDNQLTTSRSIRSLEGIPFGVKDIFNTKAFPTEMGSPVWKNFTPGNNARVVDSLLFSGGIVAGKTVTAEFAVHALNETLNPHDPRKTPGTSSSGSAAAVAVGMVPFALGTQTAGSIIRPASFCGIWGMKPSFGMIPRTGVLKTTDSLDTVGFVAAHAKSLRVILDSVRVKGPDYPFVYKNVDLRGAHPKAKNTGWRVGFVRTHTWDKSTGYAQQAIQSLATIIDREQGFTVEEVEWPQALQNAHEVHSTIYTKSLAYYFKHEKKMSSQITPMMSQMMEAGEPISPSQFIEALHLQNNLIHRLDELFSSYDLVLSLGTSSSAPERNVEELPDPSLIWTLGHVPSVAVPLFKCPAGLPFGVQFVSRKWNDYLLLQGIEALVDKEILPAGSQKIDAHQYVELDNND